MQAKKDIPKITDNRTNKKAKNIVISNYKMLDADKDKDVIDKLKKDKQDALHNPNYCIDLNTGKVKINNFVSFIVNINDPNQPLIKKDTLTDYLNNQYLEKMQRFYDNIQAYLNKTYKTFSELDKDIVSFNDMYDYFYYNDINLRVQNYLDVNFKQEYISKYADAVASLQIQEILDNTDNLLDFININLDDSNIINVISKSDLKKVQRAVKRAYSSKSDADNTKDFVKDFNKDDIEFFIHKQIKQIVYKMHIKKLDEILDKNIDFYKKVNQLYDDINNTIIKIVDNFNYFYDTCKQEITAPKPKKPQSKELSLYATKIFNNVYKGDNYTNIDLHNGAYTLKIKLIIDEVNDLRDIILYDEIQNKVVKLYPIDFALFLAFTSINSINGANIPITINDAIKHIAENDKLKIKKGNKQLDLYKDRLLLYDKTKVKAQIIKRLEDNTEYILYENKDLQSILQNTRVWINNREDEGYIIGSSAILTIINQLSKDSGIDYLATYKTSYNYINDKQSNTISILNLKYYIAPKILQMINAKNNKNIYNPKINIDELFNQLADLQGKKELSRTEKARVREQMDKFIKHLSKQLIKTKTIKQELTYNYITSDNKVIDINTKGITKPITHIKINI